MSVTIITMAGTHTPAFNNGYLVASSNNTSQPNFKYKTTIEINGGFYFDNVELEIPARPDNKRLYFNPNEKAQNYIKSPFIINPTDFFFPSVDQKSELKKVTVGIDEEYGSPVSGFAGTSASYYIWNAAYNSLDFADYVYSTTTSAKDLTTVPSLKDTIQFTQKYLYKAWHRGFSTRNLRNLVVETYDSAGNNTQTTVIENQYHDVSAAYIRNLIYFNCSPTGFNACTAPSITKSDPAKDIIPSDTVRYTFYWIDETTAVSSTTNTVYIDSFCSKYTKYVLHFLNRLGNWDSFTFHKLSRFNTDKETSSYKQIPYVLDSTNKYRYEKYTNDEVVYHTVLTNKWTLNSDYINDVKAVWLRDLIMSPQIRLEIPDDPNTVGDQSAIVAVKCTLKNYEPKKKVNDKLFNITIELENALQDVRQKS